MIKLIARGALRRALLGPCALGVLAGWLATAAPQAQGPERFMLKNARAVTSGEEFSMPVWSPNGRQLLLSSHHGMKLHLLDLKGQSLQKLSDVRGSGFDANWSPDGTQIYYRHRDHELQEHPEIKSISLHSRALKSTSLHPNGLLSAGKWI